MDRRGQRAERLSIHGLPPAVADRRAWQGHGEGDFLTEAGHRAAVGVLVERRSRRVLLAKRDDATSASALAGYTRKLNGIAAPLRASLTDDQGQERARHAELTAPTGVKVSCCNPHRPWQRGSGENTYGLLGPYRPQGTDLVLSSQEQLNEIADRLNQRPRAIHGFFPRISVYRARLERLSQPKNSVHCQVLHLILDSARQWITYCGIVKKVGLKIFDIAELVPTKFIFLVLKKHSRQHPRSSL